MRLIAVVLFIAAAAAFYADYAATADDGFRLRSIGEIWFTIDRESWLLLQPAIERHIHEDLWFSVAEPFFRQPLVVVLMVLAVLSALFWRLRRSRI